MQLFVPFFLCFTACFVVVVLPEMTSDVLRRKEPADVGFFFSGGTIPEGDSLGKQPFCKSWACILAVFGVLIG